MYIKEIYTKFSHFLFYILFCLTLISNYGSLLIDGTLLNFNTIAIVCVVGAILLGTQILFLLRKSSIKGNNLYLFFIISFICYTFFWSLINVVVVNTEKYILATIQSVELIIMWLGFIFIGYNLSLKKINIQLLLFSVVLTVISTIYYSIAVDTIAIYTKLFFTDDIEIGYQYLSRAALIVFILYAALQREYIKRNIIMIIGAYILFTIGSRSEFFAFLFSYIFVSVIDLIRDKLSIKKFLIFLFFIGVMSLVIYKNINILLETRFSEIFNISASTSWDARAGSQDKAIAQIKNSLIIGSYGGHIDEYGIRGYSHNILSAWVNYGFLGFLLYIIINLYALFYSLILYFWKKDGIEDNILWLNLILSLIILILIIFSKPIFWPLPALLWGLVLKSKITFKC